MGWDSRKKQSKAVLLCECLFVTHRFFTLEVRLGRFTEVQLGSGGFWNNGGSTWPKPMGVRIVCDD
eukprot:1430597-Prymnesium_polylepis.1